MSLVGRCQSDGGVPSEVAPAFVSGSSSFPIPFPDPTPPATSAANHEVRHAPTSLLSRIGHRCLRHGVGGRG